MHTGSFPWKCREIGRIAQRAPPARHKALRGKVPAAAPDPTRLASLPLCAAATNDLIRRCPRRRSQPDFDIPHRWTACSARRSSRLELPASEIHIDVSDRVGLDTTSADLTFSLRALKKFS